MKPSFASWIEIDRSALVKNLGQFRSVLGSGVGLLAVVKANAYGHGLIETSRILAAEGVEWLGVNALEEAEALRRGGLRTRILVLGSVPRERLEDAVRLGVRLTVYTRETVEGLARMSRRTRKKAFLHLKVETGTYRQGIRLEDVPRFARLIRSRPGLVLEGLSSHFANIEDTTDTTYPRGQLELYLRALKILDARGIRIPVRHMSCTASTILFPETAHDLVRVGIGLYGYWPSKETYLSCRMQRRSPLQLVPVLSWRARVVQVKRAPRGAFIGYGGTYRATRSTILAVIPAGYADGYSRSLSNVSFVLLRGRRAPVRGRVAMNFLTADVTDIPGVRAGDTATLIGRDGQESCGADGLASLSGTIAYEILARLNSSLPRLVV